MHENCGHQAEHCATFCVRTFDRSTLNAIRLSLVQDLFDLGD